MNRIEIIEHYKKIGIEKGFKDPEDWYEGIRKCDLGYIENRYDKHFKNINDITRAIFPDYKFYEFLFNRACEGWWDVKENVCEYLDYVYDQNRFKCIEDWYLLGNKDVIRGDLLNKLKIRYPDYIFYEWKFKIVSNNFWKDVNNIIRYLTWLFIELKFESKSDWSRLKRLDIENNYGKTLLETYSYYDLPKILYPDFVYDFSINKAYIPKWNKTNINVEILKIIERIGKFPTNDELDIIDSKLHTGIIAVYGKYSTFRKSMNIKDFRRENGYWNLDTFYNEIQPYIIDNTFPTNISLKADRYDLVYAIKLLGGKYHLAKLWDIKISKTCKTTNGVIVKSSFEQLFGNCLEELGIEYLYDKKISDNTNYRYDFKVKNVYIEIWGWGRTFKDNSINIAYNKKRILKEIYYKENSLTLVSIEHDIFSKKNAKAKIKEIICCYLG